MRVAQGYFVNELTHDEQKLAFVTFCGSIPVFFFGFFAGSMTDAFDKRKMLVLTTAIFAMGSLYLAVATQWNFVQYWQIVAVSLVLGAVSCVEMPTRQSIVSRVVPPEVLASAVPVNAMTFNVARIVGPVVGGILLANFGVPICYLIDGFSFTALIWAAYAIKSDLTPHPREPQPIWDLLFEGMRYTFRDRRLRTLFILEGFTAGVGIFYITLMPAYVTQVEGLGKTWVVEHGHRVLVDLAKQGIAQAYTAVGLGAFIGLLFATQASDSPYKATIIRGCMWTAAAGLGLISIVHIHWLTFVVFAAMGAATILQFNTTNALFQLLSPERLRGRVLSMHIWALNGLSPFGVLFFGWLAKVSRETGAVPLGPFGSVATPVGGVVLALQVGCVLMIGGALGATLSRRGLMGLA